MRPAPLPPNEAARLAALERYEILDTLPEAMWDDIAVLASRLCETPIAFITLVDEKRQWFKARVGIDVAETPRELSFCAHAILQPEELMVVEDASQDERFAANPLVTIFPGIRFYAGAPIVTPEGHALGTVCVLSPEVRQLTADQAQSLQALARQVASALEYRRLSSAELSKAQRYAEEVAQAHDSLSAITEDLQMVLDNTPGLIAYWDKHQLNRFSNHVYSEWFGETSRNPRGRHIREVIGERLYAQNQGHIEAALRGEPQSFERDIVMPDGHVRQTQAVYTPHVRDGEVQGFFVLVTDISARKQVEAALLEEKERARITLNAIGDGVITADPDGIIDYLNPVAEQMSGWPREDAIGQPIEIVMNLLDETSRLPVENPLRMALNEGQAVEMTGNACLISTDGTERSIEDRASPIRDVHGHVTGAVMVFRDVTQNRQLSRRLSHQAAHDALTGLANRGEFERVAGELICSAKAEQRQHTLLYLDLDGFKAVNDSCGHLAGDELLRQLAKALFVRLRGSDLLARLGGDEFGILLPDCPLPAALKVAKSLINVVQDHRFHWGTQLMRVGMSIGITEITAESGPLIEVLSAADTACYRAKEAGSNHVQVFEPSDHEVQSHHHQKDWLGKLNCALEEDAFELFGQRLWAIDGAEEAGSQHYEVLLRMRRKDGTVVPPGAFLPAAERYRLMVRVDQWVVRTLLQTLALSDRKTHGHEYAVNLSGASLNDPDFLGFVVAMFESTQVPWSCVCFEITETVAIANMESATHFINTLRSRGCKFALDDFGSGLSSFAYLRKLPVDYLKIDGSFVRGIDQDPVSHAMVEAICRVSSVMNIRTVAEFVETAAELDTLRRLGVHYGQGYFIHRPEAMIKPGQPLTMPAAPASTLPAADAPPLRLVPSRAA